MKNAIGQFAHRHPFAAGALSAGLAAGGGALLLFGALLISTAKYKIAVILFVAGFTAIFISYLLCFAKPAEKQTLEREGKRLCAG